jgi:short-subunit dehydrogenase
MNILITGASRGIGSALALEFARHAKHNIYLVSRNGDKLRELKEQAAELPSASIIKYFPADLTKREDIAKLLDYMQSETESIDILINNAGAIVVKEFSDFKDNEIHHQFDVNYFAPASLIVSFLPMLKKAMNPHVLNISSMSGFQGSKKFPGLSHYSASKAALNALTESLAEEFKGQISFNALCIGAVQTEMLNEAFPGYKAPVGPERMARFIMDFALTGHELFNARVIPVALSDPD